MALTESTMVNLGSKAPHFNLLGTDGEYVDIEQFKANVLVVIFTCNHCPYAKAVEDRIIELGNAYSKTVDFVLISSNDAENYPADSPERMAEQSKNKDYPFPYLFDETQKVAKAYSAVCTPDIFLYDRNRKLRYRGRLDDNWREPKKVTREELKMAIDSTLNDNEIEFTQMPSMGCNIKWKN